MPNVMLYPFPDSYDAAGIWQGKYWILVNGSVQWFSTALEALLG